MIRGDGLCVSLSGLQIGRSHQVSWRQGWRCVSWKAKCDICTAQMQDSFQANIRFRQLPSWSLVRCRNEKSALKVNSGVRNLRTTRVGGTCRSVNEEGKKGVRPTLVDPERQAPPCKYHHDAEIMSLQVV